MHNLLTAKTRLDSYTNASGGTEVELTTRITSPMGCPAPTADCRSGFCKNRVTDNATRMHFKSWNGCIT